MARLSPSERFWAKVEKRGPNECWDWLGSKQSGGYGQFRVGGEVTYVHRFSWVLHGNELPPSPLVLRHSCDNPGCVNPAHMLSGTQKENMQDKIDRGRHNAACGEQHGHAKLREADVIHIRIADMSTVELAKRYDVTTTTISAIRTGKTWRNVHKYSDAWWEMS